MMRLIDSDALNETLRGILTEFVKHPHFLRSDIEEGIDRGVGAAMQAIDDASTVDAVPVVWCKDCENWSYQECVADGNCWCDKLEKFTWKNFFCADGERSGKDAAD